MEVAEQASFAFSFLSFWNVVLLTVGYILATQAIGWGQFYLQYKKYEREDCGVPGPPSKFPYGGTWVLKDLPRLTGFKIALDKYGDTKNGLVSVHAGNSRFLVATHHDVLKELCNVAPHHDAPGSRYAHPDENLTMAWVGQESVLFVDADRHNDWVQIRRLLARSFLSTNIKKLRAPMTKVHKRFTTFLRNALSKTPNGQDQVPMQKALFAMTFDILGEAAFSTNFQGVAGLESGKHHPVLEAFTILLEEQEKRHIVERMRKPWLRAKWLWIPTPRNRIFMVNKKILTQQLTSLIEDRARDLKQNPTAQYSDFLQTMMKAVDPDSGYKFTQDQLLDNLRTILIAGQDTTGTALTYAMHSVASHPEVQKKLQAEIDEVLPNGAEPDDDTYSKLDYTRNVIRESLRMYAPIHITVRALQKDVKIANYTLKKDTTILIPMYFAMRDPYNFERPDEFIPERFDKETPFHAFMAFMHGRRTCIGQRFAEMSTALTLASLIQNFEFDVPTDYVLEPSATGPSQRPKEDLRLIVKLRSQQPASATPTPVTEPVPAAYQTATAAV